MAGPVGRDYLVVQQIAAYKLGSRSSKYLTLNVRRGTSQVAGCY
jgi:hypothetical protein